MDSVINVYPHAPLRRDRREIRLIQLHPGSGDDPIRCSLTPCSLDEGPKYAALSYTWGQYGGDTIALDNVDDFRVTANLAAALRDLRQGDAALTLWVDAVCINQSDLEETSSQVCLMQDIYSRADEVRAWIDFDLAPGDAFVERLQTLSDGLGEDASAWDTAVRLFQTPYWDRLWIQQELVRARQFFLYCRSTRLSGEAIMRFQQLVIQKRWSRNPTITRLDEWTKLGDSLNLAMVPSKSLLWWRKMVAVRRPVLLETLEVPPLFGEKEDMEWEADMEQYYPSMLITPVFLLGTLRVASRLKVTNPRDRIYGLLGLVRDCGADDIGLDYKKSVAQVYTDVANFILRKYKNPYFLPFAREEAAIDTDMDELKGQSAPAYDEARDGSALPCRGLRIDRITRVSSRASRTSHPLAALRELVLSFCDMPPTPELGRMMHQAGVRLAYTLMSLPLRESNTDQAKPPTAACFLYIMLLLRYSILEAPTIADIYNLHMSSKEELMVFIDAAHALAAVDDSALRLLDVNRLAADHDFCVPDADEFNLLMRCISRTLNFCTVVALENRERRFAAVQECAVREDDELWLLFGCQTIMVLRPAADGDEGYTVVGPACVDGITDGELVAGMGELVDGNVVDGYEVRSIKLL